MAFRKCPRCELNYITDDEKLCSVCRREVKGEPDHNNVPELCAECGVTLTGAGAAYPGGVDPKDSNIRIAPTYPTLAELDEALGVFVTCVKLVSARLARAARA